MAGIPRTTNPGAVPGFRKRESGGVGTSASSAFTPSSSVGIYLSDGDVELNLLGTPPDGIWLQPKGFTWPIPEIENVYAQSDTSEYRSRIRTRPLNPDGRDVKLFVGANNETDFWNYLDTLQEVVASVHRKKGTLRIVPPRNGEPVTFDIESIRLKDIPDDGVLLSRLLAEVTLEYECRPYGKLEERDLVVGKTLTGPVDWMLVENVPGHVNALGKLVLRETTNQAIQHLEVGLQEDFDPENPEPLTIGVEQMTLGFQGIRTTITDGINADGVRATLSTTAATVCSTGKQPHKGSWRIRARVSVSAVTVWVRLTWRVGDGPFTSEPWVAVPGASSFYDVELAVLNIPEVASGEHSWEGYIDAYASTTGTTVDVDAINPFPSSLYGQATSVDSTVGATVGLTDSCSQAGGSLNGKSPDYPSGLTYARSGSANDFATTGTRITRSQIGDSAGTGCFELVTLNHTDVEFASDVGFTYSGSSSPAVFPYFAQALRYVDASNYVLVYWGTLTFSSGSAVAPTVGVVKCVGGVRSSLGFGTLTNLASGNLRRLRCSIRSSGVVTIWVDNKEIVATVDASLATGGSLASGAKIGLYDEWTAAQAVVRNYENLSVTLLPPASPVTYSNGSVEFRANSAIRSSADGTFMGDVPAFTGRRLHLPPGGPSRIAIKRRRYNVDAGLPDSGLTDTLTADLSATGRVTAFSKQIA